MTRFGSQEESTSLSYRIVDTGQSLFYGNTNTIAEPAAGAAFYGQDAHYDGTQPSYLDHGNGTVTDLNTGLTWQKTPGAKMTWSEAVAGADPLVLGGYDDWRLPTIKELYSLMDFRGSTGQSAAASTPYIDTTYFGFEYGDTSAGERFIDAQYWSSTRYVGTTMNGDSTAFGVNFADGRIKGYPISMPAGEMSNYVRYVRGNTSYGTNTFTANGDGTVTDQATGLMWAQADSGTAMSWQAALSYAENATLAGYGDWRLPNAKELQSIIDYGRAPAATDSSKVGPAIDPVFSITNIGTAESPDYGYFWTGTSHVEGGTGDFAVYVAFGQARGYMLRNGTYVLLDVHGAGSQRSDPKTGDPDDYPHGHGPQGDVIRIDNFVRLVRDAGGGELRQGTDSAETIATGTGADTIYGVGGGDTITAGAGNDRAYGNRGDDSLGGNAGSDTLFGGQGADTIHGGQDGDVVYGDREADRLFGDLGHDSVFGGQGDDLLSGDAGDDTLFGGQGDDRIEGGAGNDWLSGDRDLDELTGGDGADRFAIRLGMGADTVTDFSYAAGDRIELATGTLYVFGSDAKGNAVVGVGNGGSLTLSGIAPGSIAADWIVFA